MQNEWILDVLTDLKTFAQKNDLTALAEQLDDTTLVAATELMTLDGKTRPRVSANGGSAGKDPGTYRARENA